ncbi:unnamed protein product [Brassica oleracea]
MIRLNLLFPLTMFTHLILMQSGPTICLKLFYGLIKGIRRDNKIYTKQKKDSSCCNQRM